MSDLDSSNSAAGVPASVRLSSRDGRLVVQFVWRADRFVQQIYLNDELVGRSIDGDDQTAWPPSPPLQQLSLEPIDEAMVVLGVGAAGRGHWSISAQPHGETSLRFDLACRSKDTPERLASTYQDSGALVWIATEPTCQVDSSHDGTSDDGRVSISPVQPTQGGTSQWSYQIEPRK